MDSARFDGLTLEFSHLLSRRGLAGALGLTVFGLPGLAKAQKKPKEAKTKLKEARTKPKEREVKRNELGKEKAVKRNEFGCVDVGKFCENGGQCCSGICQGKRGKKRKKKCQAHDSAGCQAGQREKFCGGAAVECTTSAGAKGFCNTTTGNAGYCNAVRAGDCVACAKDADCTALCGPGAACVVCTGCDETGGMGCVGLVAGGCGDLVV